MAFDWIQEWVSDQNGLFYKWVVRVLVTLGIAVVWHIIMAVRVRQNTPSVASRPKPLQEDWNPNATTSSSAAATMTTTNSNSNSKSNTEGVEQLSAREKWLRDMEEKQKQTKLSEKGDEDEDDNKAQKETIEDWQKVDKNELTPNEEATIRNTNTKSNKKSKQPYGGGGSERSSLSSSQPRSSIATTERKPPSIKAKTGAYPGLNGFHRWYDVEASLYRIYVTEKGAALPFIPKSERGQVQVELQVTNRASGPIDVFWVNYKGNESPRGSMAVGSTWFQVTWIGHPWIFRYKNTGELLLHFVPHKITPTTEEVPTVSANDSDIGVQRFSITAPHPSSYEATSIDETCAIIDPVFPIHFANPTEAVTWSLHHMTRMNFMNINLLQKYFKNIILHPEEKKYRQIRIANVTFFRDVWNTAARGILLAAGFVESGAYAELGSEDTLPRDRIQELSMILMRLEQWKGKREQEGSLSLNQPLGAIDGFGRANFGRSGFN